MSRAKKRDRLPDCHSLTLSHQELAQYRKVMKHGFGAKDPVRLLSFHCAVELRLTVSQHICAYHISIGRRITTSHSALSPEPTSAIRLAQVNSHLSELHLFNHLTLHRPQITSDSSSRP